MVGGDTLHQVYIMKGIWIMANYLEIFTTSLTLEYQHSPSFGSDQADSMMSINNTIK
jgi:hypothetical protein